jgi:hypothetical protein
MILRRRFSHPCVMCASENFMMSARRSSIHPAENPEMLGWTAGARRPREASIPAGNRFRGARLMGSGFDATRNRRQGWGWTGHIELPADDNETSTRRT